MKLSGLRFILSKIYIGVRYYSCSLTKLTQKHTKFYWDERCQGAFECLWDKLVEAPVMAYPPPDGKLILDTDASAVAVSGCLSQVQDAEERVLACYSQTLRATKRKY